ncbi:hypothetical protein [Pseudoalteromonas phage vB_PalP_Y7]|nr:hypothetical protein [Pseudoalteromonas phage vB_PalP_Y7]
MKKAKNLMMIQSAIAAISTGAFTDNGDGSITTNTGVTAKGTYYTRTNGDDWVADPNLITNEGLTHILNVALGTTPKPTGYYLALFSAAAQPQPTWTAASFSSQASEIVSMTEGYSSATRPEWKPTNTSTQAIDNMAPTSIAKVTIKTATSLTVQGAAILTNSAKGSTAGVLVSATKFAAARVFQDNDTFEIGYRLALTV